MAKSSKGPRVGKTGQAEQKLGQKLLGIYIVTTGLYFIGEQLRGVVNSRKLDLYFVGTLLYTVFLTTLIFAVEYFGLERMAAGSRGRGWSPRLLC